MKLSLPSERSSAQDVLPQEHFPPPQRGRSDGLADRVRGHVPLLRPAQKHFGEKCFYYSRHTNNAHLGLTGTRLFHELRLFFKWVFFEHTEYVDVKIINSFFNI